MDTGIRKKPASDRMRTIAVGTSVIFALGLSACGGGGGSGARPVPIAPPPATTPPPSSLPPPPPPVSTNFDTAEFRRSDGPGYHNAVAAYQAGATGAGVVVGVIDSGIDPDSHEFTGRIHPQSFDATGSNRPLEDEDGHGTQVSRVIAAAKDDRDIHGIAFNATILTLRADAAGSCTIPDPGEQEASCTFFDSAIANGINRAVDVGARVINLSLGGDGGITSSLRLAIQRAAAAGVIIIVSAGNERNDSPPDYDPLNPSPFAQALLANAPGHVIIATSVDDQDNISDFSNLAGDSRNSVLSALGDAVCCIYENDAVKITTVNGQNFVSLFAGTSFSAPQIAGAAALLAQAFPNLTGGEIVELLLGSARDVGAVGTDAIYGRGILDIGRAFSPVGVTSLAGSTIAVPLDAGAGILSGPMGDAGATAPLSAIILDRYSRAFQIDLAHGAMGAGPRLLLSPGLLEGGRLVGVGLGDTRLAFSISGAWPGVSRPHALGLSQEDEQAARLLAGNIVTQINGRLKFALGIRQSVTHTLAAPNRASAGSFLVAGDAARDNGLIQRPETSFALRQELGGFGLAFGGGNGHLLVHDREQLRSSLRNYDRYRYDMLHVGIDRQIGPVTLNAGAEWLSERDTILGARLSSYFVPDGADSLFMNFDGDLRLNGRWTLAARWRQGRTWARHSPVIATGSELRSNAFSFDLAGRDLLMNGDGLALRVGQPLRVTGGGISVNLPVAYDYGTESATYAVRQFNLAPTGREIATELAWEIPVTGGYFAANFFWRQEPGHYEYAPDDLGVAFRLRFDF